MAAVLTTAVLLLSGCGAQEKPTHPTASQGGPDTPLEKKAPDKTSDTGSGGGSVELAATGPVAEDFMTSEGMAGWEEVAVLKPTELDAAAIDQGKALFATNCASCHGATGEGGGPAAAALDPPPRNLTTSGEYKYGHLDLSVFRTIKYGVDGTGMAPWDGRMTDEETWAVVHYVKSIQKG